MDFERAKKVFDKYVLEYDMKNKDISLKYRHTYKVVDLMEELANRLNLDKEKVIVAKIIGLLHDIGRFEQLKLYSSYDDYSSIDHAKYSCDYLFRDGHIRDFLESDKYDKIIQCAIFNHNKIKIDEQNISDEELLFSKMIRDMDKVDIYRSEAVDFQMEFNANEVTKEVLESFKNGHLIERNKIKSKSDETLVTLGFIYDFNFDISLDILVETDNFDLFLSTVCVDKESEKLWKKVREICFDAINKGVN